jgi:D-beta-D-heptose 7-phosphate kinase/D-beta-D-heptose 1-phosphate adenosyltransferase
VSATSSELVQTIEAIRRPRILVVGDLMLDHYTFGKVERISPEAPVQILRVESEERKAGGAGSVAVMLRKLDAEVAVVGAVGRDEAGEELVRILEALGVDVSGVVRVDGRPTTLKTRMIAAVQHVLRVDREVDHAYEADVDATLCGHLRRLMPAADLVSVSDYGKGLLKGGLLREIVSERKRLGKTVILDPKKQADYSMYRGVSAITPNRAETELATGVKPREGDPASWKRAAEKLIADLDLEAVAVTLDKEGIYFASRGGAARHFPTVARTVYDVTGAGDMVVSVIGLCRAADVAWERTLELANVAAGIEVSRVGVAPLSRREIVDGLLERDTPLLQKIVSLEHFVAEVLPELRRKRKKVVFSNGAFDLLHVGHIKVLQFSRAQGDTLVVGLNSDRSVREIKGPGRPLIGEQERAQILAALHAVDFVILFEEPTPIRLIEAIVPDVLVKGEDYKGKPVVGEHVVKDAGGEIRLCPLAEGLSTSAIVAEMVRRQMEADPKAAAQARAEAEKKYAEVEAANRKR